MNVSDWVELCSMRLISLLLCILLVSTVAEQETSYVPIESGTYVKQETFTDKELRKYQEERTPERQTYRRERRERVLQQLEKAANVSVFKIEL